MRFKFCSFFLCFFLALSATENRAQTLGFYGGAGVSFDRFSFDQMVLRAPASFATGPLAIAGFRYHTRQNFDIMIDATIGITKIRVPIPEQYTATMQYEQLQSLLMVGSGLNIPLDEANLMPFLQVGAAFLDHWGYLITSSGNAAIGTRNDANTNRWVVMCGAGIDYQFKLFLSSGINLRVLYSPLDVFREPTGVANVSNAQGSELISLQGKLLQAQLTYRVNLPLAKWKDRYDR